MLISCETFKKMVIFAYRLPRMAGGKKYRFSKVSLRYVINPLLSFKRILKIYPGQKAIIAIRRSI